MIGLTRVVKYLHRYQLAENKLAFVNDIHDPWCLDRDEDKGAVEHPIHHVNQHQRSQEGSHLVVLAVHIFAHIL
jgi:hypothetical protein